MQNNLFNRHPECHVPMSWLLTPGREHPFGSWGLWWMSWPMIWEECERETEKLFLWVGIRRFLWVRKEASVWGLTDPSCHLWTGPSGSFQQDFPTLISRRQLCLTNSLKCQRINVKAWEVALQGVAWAGEGGREGRRERRTQKNPLHKDSNLVLWYLREKETELFITWKMETGYRGVTGLGMGVHIPVFGW